MDFLLLYCVYVWQHHVSTNHPLQSEVQDHLIKIQPQFRSTLLSNVGTFRQDTATFYHDYDTVSPQLYVLSSLTPLPNALMLLHTCTGGPHGGGNPTKRGQ